MPVFDFDVWAESTKKIPKENIAAALNAVVDRKKAIDLEPAIFAQRNAASTIYHSTAPHEEVEGVVVWVPPVADFAAYPTGFEVTHLGKKWVNIDQDVATGEPGTDPAWQETTEPEEVPSE
ncbi:hypothetical protein [Corynebacterium glutamicum]|uniref:Uncharacterized protein n=2 Tax=Corynebacterium glutamicum TaxID=1718 RepID=Q5KRK1_CORGT|nr:hypothetical protein [Corynebacterium glutamicum]BAD84080.1 hypothetical protein [Corynebacterium glutamicum]BAF54872.1 hypothetical protein cgR_1877 [Corynebacterium glutamicum R]